jgi:hypothetical protein
MHLYGPVLGVVVGSGILIWIATNGAVPLGPHAIAALAMLGTWVAFAIGYGVATLDGSSEVSGHPFQPKPSRDRS